MLNTGIGSERQAIVVQARESPICRWMERIVLSALILFLCLHTLPKAWKSLITDFPNLYLSAQLAHEGYDTSRMYEWIWQQREKDHRAIDVRVIGLIPVTPFSTLFIYPLTGVQPLAAKRIWIVLNLMLLFPIGWLLQSMTGLGYRRIALAFAMCFPLHRDLEFGQFYLVILLLIVAACWAYLRGLDTLAGSLIAIAAACKIFPILFFALLLRRRAWRALASGAITGLATLSLSVLAFGWNVHRTYLDQILPWALHGEALPPYLPTASIPGLLHLLFLPEPQWNPNPWHSSVLFYALLMPTLQMLILAPAILIVDRKVRTAERIMLEWSALLTAALTISTIPALYNFVLMVFPVCVVTSRLLRCRRYGWLAVLLVAFIAIGLPVQAPQSPTGFGILLFVLRLPLMMLVLLGIYSFLWAEPPAESSGFNWPRFAWAACMVLSVAFSIRSTFLRESLERQEYAFRLPIRAQGYLNADPQALGEAVRYIAFTFGGFHLMPKDPTGELSADDLSFASCSGQLWVERARDSGSVILNFLDKSAPRIDEARDPKLSIDGNSLGFIRDDHGRGQLMMRTSPQSMTATDVALTPPSFNVYEASFLSGGEYAFSAVASGGAPQIYLTDATHKNTPLAFGESRYPALSPDGRWLAYSRLEQGVWNLWLWDRKTGVTKPIGDVPCNEIEPSWYADSKTLLYGTDCGRSLWFTAVARRRVIP
jgi:hypothetical protein